jgi:hypothetical protein
MVGVSVQHGIEPAPIRGRRMSWTTFIKAHLGTIAAADFFYVEVMSWAGLIRYHVLFLIDVASRRVEIAGVTRSPDGCGWIRLRGTCSMSRTGSCLIETVPAANTNGGVVRRQRLGGLLSFYQRAAA